MRKINKKALGLAIISTMVTFTFLFCIGSVIDKYQDIAFLISRIAIGGFFTSVVIYIFYLVFTNKLNQQ